MLRGIDNTTVLCISIAEKPGTFGAGLQGKITIPGAVMFIYQAAEQFRLYTGHDAPPELIRSSLRESGS